jgi:hypothetical protein
MDPRFQNRENSPKFPILFHHKDLRSSRDVQNETTAQRRLAEIRAVAIMGRCGDEWGEMGVWLSQDNTNARWMKSIGWRFPNH